MFLLMREKCRRFCTQMFDGEVTFKKTDFWLLMLIAALLGMLWGLIHAPFTHGVTVEVGNNNGNTYLENKEEDEER